MKKMGLIFACHADYKYICNDISIIEALSKYGSGNNRTD